MSDINLEDGKIKVDDEWLSADDLTGRIQEKMNSGDMKFASLAAALEELKGALDASHVLEIRTVITQKDYDRLKELGGGDDRECVRQAVMAFIGGGRTGGEGDVKKRTVTKCSNCQTVIEIPAGERPSEIRCPKCNAVGRLKPKTA